MSNEEKIIEEKIKDLTPELLADIYDITEKFGTLNEEDQIINFSSGDLGLGYKLYISISAILGNKNLVISKNVVMLNGSKMVKLKDGYIIWDKTLTVEDVINTINKIDELAKKFGLMDHDNKRKRIGGNFVEKNTDRYIVEDVFEKQGTVFMVPAGKDPEKMLGLFDHPEKLTIVTEPFGTTIRLKDGTEYLERRKNIAMELLKEKGISIEYVKNLTLEDILEMREEIDKRLTKDKHEI